MRLNKHTVGSTACLRETDVQQTRTFTTCTFRRTFVGESNWLPVEHTYMLTHV
jgi:hypothetical protein